MSGIVYDHTTIYHGIRIIDVGSIDSDQTISVISWFDDPDDWKGHRRY